MSYIVRFTETAKNNLREIAFYIADQSKETAIAKGFVLELRETCHRLTELPGQGALPKDRILRSMGYRYLSHKGYLIFYLTDEQEHIVDIMAIFHEKQDYIRVMRKYI
ncbi:MAG: type II toxin-antitoxin system RelE/ParE family toxin [Clostridia bacterium]|nr:type II toxin-antitoxin system RelE/ParE family toxin [Clostridia bacterium]